MIYVAEAIGLRVVAIGSAKNVEARLKACQAASPAELRLLKVFEGGSREALELHLRFRAHHVHATWYFLPPIAAAIEALERIELVEVHARCPRCGRPKSEDRAEWRGRYCIRCSQKGRWEKLTPEQKAAGVAGMLAPEPRERARAPQGARIAELCARAAQRIVPPPTCADCRAVLPFRPGESPRAIRRCRSCAMKRVWRRTAYRRSSARGRAAFLAKRCAR